MLVEHEREVTFADSTRQMYPDDGYDTLEIILQIGCNAQPRQTVAARRSDRVVGL